MHEAAAFEAALVGEVLPLAVELGLNPIGVWKSVVGKVGEYLELWQFESLAEFEDRWAALMNHPRFQQITQRTGPMVEEEQSSLFEPLAWR